MCPERRYGCRAASRRFGRKRQLRRWNADCRGARQQPDRPHAESSSCRRGGRISRDLPRRRATAANAIRFLRPAVAARDRFALPLDCRWSVERHRWAAYGTARIAYGLAVACRRMDVQPGRGASGAQPAHRYERPHDAGNRRRIASGRLGRGRRGRCALRDWKSGAEPHIRPYAQCARLTFGD